jgi:hypothetical protein
MEPTGMKMKEIQQGIIGEGMVGRRITSFISVVGCETYFGYKEVMTGRIIEVENVMDFRKAINRVINHAAHFLNGGNENGKDNEESRQWKGIHSR